MAKKPTACLALADGTVFHGQGFGAVGEVVAELAPDLDMSAEAFPYMSYREAVVAGVPARIFRISFSGELSYEIAVPANRELELWERLHEVGRDLGTVGLRGDRDVLSQPVDRYPHQISIPNAVVKRTSPSTMSRMSGRPLRNCRVRSMPMPKAKPV